MQVVAEELADYLHLARKGEKWVRVVSRSQRDKETSIWSHNLHGITVRFT